MMIPVSLEEQLVPGTLEYAIHHLIENRVDTSIFNERFSNDDTGRMAYSPKVLLKIVLFGYSRGMLSSRSLERGCKENVTFMALACGQKPDHSTIAAFVSSLGDEISVVFSQILLVCEEEDMLGGTHFSMDGLNLPSNASKEWSGRHGELKKKQEKLEAKVRESIQEHREVDKREGRKRTGDGDGRREGIKRLRG
jgi:transposase